MKVALLLGYYSGVDTDYIKFTWFTQYKWLKHSYGFLVHAVLSPHYSLFCIWVGCFKFFKLPSINFHCPMYCKEKGTNFRNTLHLMKGFCIFYHQRNEEIMEELKVEPADEKLRRYKSNWLRHKTRMKKSNTMPKITLNYRTNERRRLGTRLKRL